MTVLDEFGTVRYRITVRGEEVELRGHLTATLADLNDFAGSVQEQGWVVVASPLTEADMDFIQQADHTRAVARAVVRHWDSQSSPDQDEIGWRSDLEKAVEQLRGAIQ
jgi:hypothetical protein